MDRPGAWVHRVAMNLVTSRFRRVAAEARAYRRHGPAQRFATDADPAEAREVREAVAALPPRTRTAVVCRYFAELTVAETAEVLGCAEGTVRSLTHRGLVALRDQLGVSMEVETDA